MNQKEFFKVYDGLLDKYKELEEKAWPVENLTQDLIDTVLKQVGIEYSLSKDTSRGWGFWYWYLEPKCEWAKTFSMRTDFKWYDTKISAATAAFLFIVEEEKI
jgi:hypothetical protein